jgi:hypothetical protein
MIRIWIVLGWTGKNRYFGGAMTRSSIELSIKIFLFCLVAVFIYTVVKVVGMIV